MTNIRRSLEDAVFPDGTPSARYRTLPVANAPSEPSVRYWRKRWERGCLDGSGVRRRSTSGLIMAGRSHVGSVELLEVNISPLTSRDSFLDQMDQYSSSEAHLAEAVLSHWDEPVDLTDHGPIVELRRVWMRQSCANRGMLGSAINGLLDHLFDERSLLILKAFPLEYEGQVTDDNRQSFLKRQRAMMRHYGNILGVAPLSGSTGDRGWMYAIPQRRTCVVPMPLQDCFV